MMFCNDINRGKDGLAIASALWEAFMLSYFPWCKVLLFVAHGKKISWRRYGGHLRSLVFSTVALFAGRSMLCSP